MSIEAELTVSLGRIGVQIMISLEYPHHLRTCMGLKSYACRS